MSLAISRSWTVLAFLAIFTIASNGQAQINPAGFLDPAGVNRNGTANPPNTTIGPIGGSAMSGSMYGSTLPPGASGGMSREVETNPALRQEVRRPFGGGGYRRAGRAGFLPGEENGEGQGEARSANKINLSERQSIAPVKMAEGPATGKLAEDWRYKYFEGRHWYWMPNNTWDVWHNAMWMPYKPRMFSQPLFGYGTQVRGYRACRRIINMANRPPRRSRARSRRPSPSGKPKRWLALRRLSSEKPSCTRPTRAKRAPSPSRPIVPTPHRRAHPCRTSILSARDDSPLSAHNVWAVVRAGRDQSAHPLANADVLDHADPAYGPFVVGNHQAIGPFTLG